MKLSLSLSLRAGERLYVNGAVLRVDRRVSIQFLNDVTFLLEAHVMQPEEATTPLRQLYFMAQAMLIDPACRARQLPGLVASVSGLLGRCDDRALLSGLLDVRDAIGRDRIYEAMKILRGLFPLECSAVAGG